MYFRNEPSTSDDFLTQKYLKKPQKFAMSYNCNFMYFQNEPSANPFKTPGDLKSGRADVSQPKKCF